jgi:uncharacterized membrane protein YccC
MLDPGPWTLAALAGLFAAVLFATAFVNYAVYAAAITAWIVFFVALGGADEWPAVVDRLLDTTIGGALALGAYALFPTWESDHVRARIADLIEADRAYAKAVLQAWIDPGHYQADALYGERLNCRRVRTEAEGSIQLALSEPARHRGDVDGALEMLSSLRRIADGVLALEAGLEDASARRARPAIRPLARDHDRALTALAAAERDGRKAAPLPSLRAEHDTLAEAEGADSLLAQVTDRVVNAVGSLGHLLADGSVRRAAKRR